MPGHYGKGMKGKKSGKMNGLKKATKAIAAKKKMKAKKNNTTQMLRLLSLFGHGHYLLLGIGMSRHRELSVLKGLRLVLVPRGG